MKIARELSVNRAAPSRSSTRHSPAETSAQIDRHDRLASGRRVLVRGRRRPIAGTVTMDQLMVDLGDEPVEVGEEVVLLGRQGDEEIGAAEWAGRLDTIAYEVVTGIGPRVPRRYER